MSNDSINSYCKGTNYIHSRLNDQIKWYDNKSCKAKKELFVVTFISVFCTSLIPIVTLLTNILEFKTKLYITILSQIINIATWYIHFKKLDELKIKYRSTCEHLKTHKILFENNCSPYNNCDTANELFIINCELLMDEEHTDWANLFKNQMPNSQSIGS